MADHASDRALAAPRTATVVLPAYGVEPAIGTVVRDLAVASYALRTRGIGLDVLLLDGGDHEPQAREVADELGVDLRCVRGPEAGPGAAFREGMRLAVEAGVDLVVTMDSNGRHDATQIPLLVDELIRRRCHVVIGSRWTRGSGTPGLSPARWFLGRAANVTFRWVTGTPRIRDATTSFRVARREVLEHLGTAGSTTNTYGVHTTFVAKAVAEGYRVAESPIIYREAIAGGGGLTSADIGEFAIHLLELREVARTLRHRRLSPAGRTFDVHHFAAEADVECLAASKHFFEWVLEEFRPFLKGDVLEVGAGSGAITRRLIEGFPDISVVALEPADNMFSILQPYAALTERVAAEHATLAEFAVRRPRPGFDAVLYVNVLEHIEDDERELRLAAEALRPGGSLLVFGPALELLYAELDHNAGHYRRYSLDQVRRIVEGAGLRVVSLRYFDVLGVLPYFVVYRLLRHTNISSSTVWGYDRGIVPLSRVVQRILRDPPVGKNVILVAEKDRSDVAPRPGS
ncbi:MAG TPA: methyltransferase domain-containing protein [Actinomycetota bacterium]|nr:methyltransferase domain-containing protein [Actinomycetota bacterium]